MPATETWTQQNATGRLVPGEHFARGVDVTELRDAVNRRRRLTYQADATLDLPVRLDTAPVEMLRNEVEGLIEVPGGALGGDPASPESMQWLWPVDDGDLGKRIVGGTPGAGEVNLFAKLNGSDDWTDPDLSGGDWLGAAAVNELRQALEWLSRGRWTLPIYFAGGLFDLLPDTPWTMETVAHDEGGEIRAVGFATFRDGAMRGLSGVNVTESSFVEITAGSNCSVGVHRCKRAVDLYTDRPTWNEYDPSGSGAWSSPGGLGAEDAEDIGAMSLIEAIPGQLSGPAVVGALQAIVDGAEPNFLVRKTNLSYGSVYVTGRVRVDFQLSF